MQRRDLDPSYSATIAACSKGGQWEKALELFDELQQRGLEPNLMAYNATISVCERAGQCDRALELFDELQDRGLEPDTVTYNATISACEAARRFDDAQTLFLRAQATCYPRLYSVRGALDLHHLSVLVARVAVRLAIADFLLRSDRDVFIIITGRDSERNNGKAVLRPAIFAYVRDDFSHDVDCVHDPSNPGRLVVIRRQAPRWWARLLAWWDACFFEKKLHLLPRQEDNKEKTA